ncbi:hypothetical protein B0T17DRAFT_619558 [Bombardia bombarda]|uniref:Heme oxygenase n=1 Tax=Bombardia bombarda TaxID=252184 RepID=A0AA40BWB2_9PEZI|nr:hypothetical protein B0T17DRAFT_619558 [Bombardia bombarda]
MESKGATSKMDDHPHLGDSINVATRSVHTELNKRLRHRLPLAVPPGAHTPAVYVSGLIHVASVYITFESLWRDILSSSSNLQNGDNDYDEKKKRINSILADLRLPGLERSSSLRADIRAITGWPDDVVDEQIKAVSAEETGGRLGQFVAHIKRSVNRHPHVLLAYAWVLYMALFSGGRLIRAALETAGHEFWSTTAEPMPPSMRACEKPIAVSSSTTSGQGEDESDETPSPTSSTSNDNANNATSTLPLAFFRFATPLDGEDLKLEFKKRLVDAEARLWTDEWDHIVQEAHCIFDNMILLIAQLDGVFSNHCAPPTTPNSLNGRANLPVPRLGGRLRDSVALAKERGLRALSMASSAASTTAKSSLESLTELVGSGGDDERPPPVPEMSALRENASALRENASTTTGTCCLHAKGAVTSSDELLEKSAILSGGKAEGTTDAARVQRTKSVRFRETSERPVRGTHGKDDAAATLSMTFTTKDGVKAVVAEETSPQESASMGVTTVEKRRRSSTAYVALLWNALLIIGVTGSIYIGLGNVRRW